MFCLMKPRALHIINCSGGLLEFNKGAGEILQFQVTAGRGYPEINSPHPKLTVNSDVSLDKQLLSFISMLQTPDGAAAACVSGVGGGRRLQCLDRKHKHSLGPHTTHTSDLGWLGQATGILHGIAIQSISFHHINKIDSVHHFKTTNNKIHQSKYGRGINLRCAHTPYEM